MTDGDGRARFRKYLPADRAFVNTIEDYPYPYVIGGVLGVPVRDAERLAGPAPARPNNPLTVRDWNACLDCTVIKQGVFNLVFHPHGWIESEQIVELIDYAMRSTASR